MALILPNQSVALQAYAVLVAQEPGYTALNDHLAYIAAKGVGSYTAALDSVFANTSTATLAATMIANLGLTGIVSQADAVAYLNSNSQNRVGAMINLSNVLYNYAGTDAKVLAAQTAYKTSIDTSYSYSIVPANTSAVALTPSAGTTFTLTTGIDNIAGTGGNDNIIGLVDFNAGQTPGAASTYNTVDTIRGGTGADTLALTLTNAAGGAITALTTPDISGVETVSIRNVSTQDFFAAGAGAYDVAGFGGATNFVSDRSTGKVFLKNLTAGSTVGLNGNGLVNLGDVEAAYAATVTTETLNLSNGTLGAAVTLLGAASTGLTINSTGAANKVASIAAAATTTSVAINAATNLTVTGGITGVAANTTVTASGAAASVDLGALAANVKSVDASGLTAGGLTATIGAVAQTITGGAGNDVITTNGVQTGTVAAGAGTADKLIVAAATDITAASGAKFTGFEILQNNAAATVNAANVAGITSVVMNNAGAGGFTGLSAAQAGAVSAILSTAGSTLALADASGLTDVISLTGTTTTAATAVNVTNLNVTNVETLNYTNSATAASTLSLAGTGTGLKTISVAGAKGVTLDVAAANTPAHATTLTSINASSLTAQATGTNTFTLQDTVGNHALKSSLVVTGSAGDDLFSFGGTAATDTIATGLVTVNGGAGNDVLSATIGQLFTTGSGAIAFNGGDNGSSTGDTLNVLDTAAGVIADDIFANVTNVENVSFANTGAISLTSGGFFKSAFATNGVTITDGATTTNNVTFDLTSFTGTAKITNVGTTGIQTITGGSAADTITITSALASTAGTDVVIKGGAGADTIKVTDASVTTVSHAFDITGGTGADKITLAVSDAATAVSKVFINVAVDDSVVATADTVTGFYAGAGAARLSDTIDFAGNAVAASAIATTAVTGSTLAQLAFTVSAAGQLTFTGTNASTVTAAQVESIWTSQIATLVNNLGTVVWADANAADSAQYGNSLVLNHNTAGDSEVVLVGVQATAVGTAAATAGLVGIA